MWGLLIASALAFAMMAALGHHGGLASVCAEARRADFAAAIAAGLHAPVRVCVDWAVMIVAMMAPLLSMTIAYIRNATHPSAKTLATASFLAVYGGLWFATGAVLIPLAAALASLLDGLFGTVIALLLAASWSASPWAQRARNRCHRNVRIGGLPPATYVDSARQGWMTGSGCVIACWPWMVAPMIVVGSHFAWMIGVTVYLFIQRMEPATRPRWRWPLSLEPILGSRYLVIVSQTLRSTH